MGIEVTARDRAALANATFRFAVVSSANRDVLVSQDISLSPDGPLTQFVRATLNLATASPGAWFAQASIITDGKVIGVVDSPFRIDR